MPITASPSVIKGIWDAARQAPRARKDYAACLTDRAVRAGWVTNPEFEDLLVAHGFHLGLMSVGEVLGLFGIKTAWMHIHPGRDTLACGSEHVSVFDVAHLLIHLERAGVPVDPAPLTDALRPTLKCKQRITAAELAVLWHPRERHRLPPFEIEATRFGAAGKAAEGATTATGYRIARWEDDEGKTIAFRATAPGRSRAKPTLLRVA